MSLRLRRKATRELTRIRLVLSPRRNHGGWFAFSALLAGTVSIAATTHFVPGAELPFGAPTAVGRPSPPQRLTRRSCSRSGSSRRA